ncbi:tripartite tricarboxylate transporter TctB family protein [uncultured Roseovarius sp.]|uniref:tripartite tricarboxylate transporter TctB family protein n=1 Tax=Roseovarius sp. TaxID=1486281 RepID=UPI001D62319E|nr:tripartite tricarboxylate transporter TctB family protein [uncultured Roseovarius sp.]TNE37555.1 MAG: tripartite tricarboxylate transporter TctB family protein [Sphingomonadales bacterium]
MSIRTIQVHLGIGACLVALFLILYGIPNWVSSPSNVRKIILSPLFWPYIIAGLTGLVGLGLIVFGRNPEDDDSPANEIIEDPRAGIARLAAMAVLMMITFWALPRIGMVWAAMGAFAALAFLVKTRHPKIALACAVFVPLVLYAFFAHVAGVAIPQGNYVRLP